MVAALLKQNLLRIRRSPEFQKRLVTNIILGFLILISVINMLVVAINLNNLFKSIPGLNPIKMINEIAFVYFPFDYILRLVFQKYRTASIKPYLVQNIKREKIVDLILIKTSQSLLNLIPFVLFLPFAMTEMVLHYSALSVTAWFLTIVFVCFSNAYIVNYSKIMFRIYPVKTVLIHAAVFAAIGLSYFLIPAYPRLWSTLMKVVLQNPYLCLTPLITAILMFKFNHRFLLANLFIEELRNTSKEKRTRENALKEDFTFLTSFGHIGSFIMLELKMIFRNRRPKPVLFTSFLMVFYGLLFYSDQINHDMFKVFVGSFMTGIFIFSYGILAFGWESSYFGLIMTGRIEFRSYLRAKYYFMIAVTTILYILTTFYIIYGIKIFLINTAMFLFNIGITPYIILFMAEFNKIRYDLNESLFSQQGRGTQQYVGSLLVVAIQIGIFYLLTLFLSFETSLLVICILGAAGLLLHIQILSYLEMFFHTKKYSMIEGFRKT